MFKFNKNGDTWTTPLVIDDTPGAENLLESYIFNNNEINQNYLQYFKLNKGHSDAGLIWNESTEQMKKLLNNKKQLLSVEAFEWPNKNNTNKDATWAFSMMCASLMDPLWLNLLKCKCCSKSIIY